mmetsp:Transcript_26670/g.83437  ORF Transcript_26670/g.83437 Transcript_26670/m.83437 type:complete len:169 (-) Transcript_26670:1457-1963(-)
MLARAAIRASRAGLARSVKPTSFRCLSDEVAEGLKLNLCSPGETVYANKVVERVIVPGADGEYGVTEGHSPIVAELKAGVVQITHKGSDEVEKFFVSGGFALTHEDSTTDISVPEVVRLEDIDEAAVKSGFADASSKLSAANDDAEKAVAQIEMETYKAMGAALGVSL